MWDCLSRVSECDVWKWVSCVHIEVARGCLRESMCIMFERVNVYYVQWSFTLSFICVSSFRICMVWCWTWWSACSCLSIISSLLWKTSTVSVFENFMLEGVSLVRFESVCHVLVKVQRGDDWESQCISYLRLSVICGWVWCLTVRVCHVWVSVMFESVCHVSVDVQRGDVWEYPRVARWCLRVCMCSEVMFARMHVYYVSDVYYVPCVLCFRLSIMCDDVWEHYSCGCICCFATGVARGCKSMQEHARYIDSTSLFAKEPPGSISNYTTSLQDGAVKEGSVIKEGSGSAFP